MRYAGEKFAQSLLSIFKGDHRLVLEKAALAVEAIPIFNGVERVKEIGVVPLRGLAIGESFTPVELLINADGRRVSSLSGASKGKGM